MMGNAPSGSFPERVYASLGISLGPWRVFSKGTHVWQIPVLVVSLILVQRCRRGRNSLEDLDPDFIGFGRGNFDVLNDEGLG
jgi:hypothetical protein